MRVLLLFRAWWDVLTRDWVMPELPVWVWACLVVLAVVLMVEAVSFASETLYARAVRKRYAGVRLCSLTHTVRCVGGGLQPDGRVYPDSDRISWCARLELPSRERAYPLRLAFVLVRPGGDACRTRKVIERYPEGGACTVRFSVAGLRGMFAVPGVWAAAMEVEDTGCILGAVEFEVVSPGMLLDDLELVDAALAVSVEGQVCLTRVVLPEAEWIAPLASLRARTYHPSKFTGFQVRAELVSKDALGVEDAFSLPLDLSRGEMRLGHLARAVANGPLSRGPGEWEFRFSVESKLVGVLAFRVVSLDEIVQTVEIEHLGVAGAGEDGRFWMLGEQFNREWVEVVVPVLSLRVPYPSPWAGMVVQFCVWADGRRVGEFRRRVRLDRDRLHVAFGEFRLPALVRSLGEDARPSEAPFESWTFGVVLGNGSRASRVILGFTALFEVADAEGRLDPDAPMPGVDVDAEASRILREAGGGRVVRGALG